MTKNNIKKLIFIFPILLFCIFLSIKLFLPKIYVSIIQEDALIEYSQVLVYFITSMFSLRISIIFFKLKLNFHAILYSIFTLGFLFIFFEELSWGQRIINIDSLTFIIEHNAQRETTIHNLKIFNHLMHDLYIIIGFFGAFSWLLVKKFIPKAKTDDTHLINFIVPHWYISSYFFFVFLIYSIIEYVSPLGLHMGFSEFRIGKFIIWRDQEPMELILSLGFLSFNIINFFKLQKYFKKYQK